MADDTIDYGDVRVISATCLCTNVQRAARSIGRRFDQAFRPLKLTNWQFTLMVALFRPEAPTINLVAQELSTDRTTITANLKPLERRGLVSSASDEADRRVRRVALTEDGRRLLQDAYVIWKRVQQTVECDLALSDTDRLLADLRTITAI